MKKQILYFSFTFSLSIYLSISLYAQNETGNPFITNYYAEEYKGHSQNWSIIQDKRGLIYIANGNGIMVYDSDSWEMINIPNDLMVRDLAISGNGLIYAASHNELGYLQPNDQGKTEYISLRDSVNIESDIGTIWEIIQIDEKIYFRSMNYLICLDKNGFKHWKAKTSFDLSFKYNNDIYLYEEKNGLFIIKNDELVFAPFGEKIVDYNFNSANQIEDKVVFINNKNGLFIYKVFDQFNAEFKHLDCEANEFILENKVVKFIVNNFNEFIIATNNGGCLLTNIHGEILNIINTESGLQSNNIRDIFIDDSKNLWLALNKGIAKCNISLPITFWSETNGLEGVVLNMIRFNDIIYIATHQGIYYLKENKTFKINALSSSSWCLLKYKDIKKNKEYLLLGTQESIFSVEKDKIIKVAETNNVFTLYQSKLHPEIVYFGTSDDIGILEYSEGTFTFKGMVSGTGISVRSIKEEDNGDIWISTFRHDVIKLIPSGDPLNPKKIIRYNINNGLPSLKNILIYEFNNETVFATEKGLYKYNSETNSFIPEETFKDIFPGKQKDIFSFCETNSENVWISQLNNKKGSVGFAALNSNGTYTWNSEMFNIIPEMMVLAIYPEEDGSVWIGGSEGLFYYDHSIESKYNSKIKTYIRKVIINSDSVIFYGNYYNSTNNKRYFSEIQNENFIFNLSYKYNSITFHYATPDFINESSTEYQFFLEGFDSNWSDWSLNTKKEYTNLPERNYIFKVRAKNIYSNISETAEYKFTVCPPWYRTIAAYIIYFILTVLSVWLIVRLSIRRLRNLNIELENQIEKRTLEINNQKEEILSQSEELERKNSELEIHRNRLEQLVRERTADLLTAKEKAEESDRLKSAFLANMSHEIRTPMNAIIGFSSLLNDKEFDKKKRKELISYIIQGSDTLLHLIDDIIDISKIEAGQLEIYKDNFYINEIFDELIDIYEDKKISEFNKNIELKFIKKEDENIVLHTDNIRLQQVLINLIDNALKFTEKGSVEIGYVIKDSSNKQAVIFRVKDSGIGLTKQQQNKIFSRFTKLESEREKLYRGAGLGLSICKNIVELLGGEIWIDSELNKGSTFYFSIPYIKNLQSEKKEHIITHVDKNYDFSGKTILIAEDETSNFMFLKMILDETNVNIIHAKNGNEAFQIYKENKIDLILMDIKMPVADGLKTTKRIRSEDPDIPIIAQTAFAMEDDKKMSINAGCNDYISKPINKQKLLGFLHKYLS